MASDVVSRDAVDRLRSSVAGEVCTPDDAGYEQVRQIHNGMIDKRPAVIVRCQNTADVVDAVKFAREHDLEISIRGGGHNVAGRAVTDGGLMVDTQTMKGVHVDPASRRVRAQPGLTWDEYNRATAAYGLATTGESCPPPVSRDSLSAVDSAGSWANTAWRSTTFDRSRSLMPTARSLPPTSSSTQICTGLCEAEGELRRRVVVRVRRSSRFDCFRGAHRLRPPRRSQGVGVLRRVLRRSPRRSDSDDGTGPRAGRVGPQDRRRRHVPLR